MFEYKIDRFVTGSLGAVEKEMNLKGAEGWDIVSATLKPQEYTIIYKRPLKPQKKVTTTTKNKKKVTNNE